MRASPLVILTALALAIGGCGGRSGASAPSASAASESGGAAGASGRDSYAVPGPKYPTPYTAEQIRAATKAGRTYRYRVEASGKPPSERALTFASVDATGAELVTEGEGKKRVTWEELRQHAEFPAAIVRTREERVTVPAGTFDCIAYVVLGEEGEASTFFFAKDLPGAPVQIFVNKDGRRVTTTKLVEHRPGK